MEECQILRLEDFRQRNGKRDPDYLAVVSKFVSENRCKEVPLCYPVGAKLTIGSLEDTEYKDRPAVVNGWGKFYLPKLTKMEVIGYAKGTTYPCDQLVLMTCEDQKVYGFDGDELHLVASSPRQMVTEGIADSASQSYYHGEAFKDMTKEDWSKVEQGPVGKRLEEELRNLVASRKPDFLKNLKIIRQRRRCHQQNGNILPKSNVTQLQKGGT
ncbi:uncharacterized protein LOC103146010 [Poecilia formosa]|uniref:Uncharacterized LOC103146010 n=1 Tax=Poecilia formosa TaxID=48698 RepID=A0A087X5G7_POEFO|nr:PREDICTED: uncharacterized protein LOC103146010 [Poecilia formosa]XP_007563774.1 PREDICTED: uncharacterized protein LOC103146010 [Poecilia formosa]XP_016532718.1 PREDICTED: uncharacterized protein LOC103146010 [Poecilia formosa]XP_016532719.1 PREDICTED: uncharacterized protein LOC103146010 [Poecilia formosa]